MLQALLDAPAAQGATLPRAQALAAVANLLQQVGSYATAEDYCEEALAIARAADNKYLVGELLAGGNEGACALRADRPGHGRSRRGDLGWSARLHGAADQALGDLGRVLEPLEGRLADLDRQRLRAAMGAGAFEAEYAAGHVLDLAQVPAEVRRKEATTGQAGAAHEAAPGMPAGRAVALVSERDAAASGEAVTVLTLRELDVLKLVGHGLSNPDIAQRLFLSEHTVHRHLANILRKLDLSSRAAAAAWGVRSGLL